MDTLEYEFDDLPFKVEGGFEAGNLEGKAIVSYHEDGEWSIRNIYLLGSKTVYVNGRFDHFDEKYLEVEEYHNDPTYLIIWSQLTDGRFKDCIQSKVNDALVDEGIRMPTDVREHGTHHAAYSGIV